MTARHIGARAGIAVVLVGATYAVVLAVGMVQAGLSEPIVDPVLAIMEVLTIASALPLLMLFAALHACVPPATRLWATLALCSAVLFAGATIAVHFVELTAGRQRGSLGLVWPSATYAVELFAWDLALGLALLCAARALPTDPESHSPRAWLTITGALCLVGLVGPVLGIMGLQRIGVFGYAVVLPIAAWKLSMWFRREARLPQRVVE